MLTPLTRFAVGREEGVCGFSGPLCQSDRLGDMTFFGGTGWLEPKAVVVSMPISRWFQSSCTDSALFPPAAVIWPC